MITAAVITIGDEILFGQITDTNSKEISEALSENGIRTVLKFSVGDEKKAIIQALSLVQGKTDIVIFTGGLGPTKDDITKKTLADFFGSELVMHPDALDHLKAFFARRNRELDEVNKGQALLPDNCTYIVNNYGTAPGMWFEEKDQVYISLPGVPGEMRNLLKEEILPRLISRFKPPVITHRWVRTIGIGESILSKQIESWEDALPAACRLAYLPEAGQVKLRLTVTGTDQKENEKIAEEQISLLNNLITPYIYAHVNEPVEKTIGHMLTLNGLTAGTAESCTGGAIAAALTSIAGSSAYFKGGIVAYSNELKKKVLQVNQATLDSHGAVSEETVKEMAIGARQLLNVDFAVSCSGIAGPAGGSLEKPVGTVWIACADKNGVVARKFIFGPDRIMNIRHTVVATLNLLRQRINGQA
jgi:nicotinamide-nucleotide amidase